MSPASSRNPEAITELDLCRAWSQLPRSIPLRTIDGQFVDVIHLGAWTHGLGPDFRNALLSFDSGEAVAGSIELHLRTRGWIDHGHHLDRAYNTVGLHVVGHHDEVETRRADGKLVPTVVLNMETLGIPPVEFDWSLVGGEVCAADLSRRQPVLIRQIIGALGDIRLSARSARIEARFASRPPEAVLYAEIMDGFGYSSNREAMSSLISKLPWQVLIGICRSDPDPTVALRALFLGSAGYLPLSDVETEHTGLTRDELTNLTVRWVDLAAKWTITPLTSTSWNLARIRPANHPIRRLIQAAALLGAVDLRLESSLMDPIRASADPTGTIVNMINTGCSAPIGSDRARAITTNVLIPFAFALASQLEDKVLADAASAIWESLPPAESNERTRRATRQVTGSVGLGRQGARLQQGLIHLDQTLCEPRRCFECPIATVALQDQQVNGTRLSPKQRLISKN